MAFSAARLVVGRLVLLTFLSQYATIVYIISKGDNYDRAKVGVQCSVSGKAF